MTTKAQEDFMDELIRSRAIESTTQGQIEVLDGMNLPEIRDEFDPDMAEKPSQLGRFVAQGATFGFADEIEAMAQSMFDQDVDYTTARNEIRRKMADYAKDNGGKALAAEFAGAIPGTVLAIFGGPGTWSAALANIVNLAKTGKSIFNAGKSVNSIINTANKSGLATGAYTVGANEKEMFGDDANLGGYVEDAASGYGVGAALGGGISLLAKPFSKGVVYAIDKMRSGTDKMSKVVRKELQRMVKKTGLTEEQIIQKVNDGEIIAENETLKFWIKSTMSSADSGLPQKTLMDTMSGTPATPVILNKAGEVIEDATKSTPSRSKITRDELKDTMQESLGRGGVDDNLMKIHLLEDLEFRDIERIKYDKIFKENNFELDKATTNQVLRTIEGFADGAEDINAMFRANGNLVPFYNKLDDGSIELIRQPTVQDAEIIYRSIRDKTDELYRNGKGNLGKAFQNIQDDLKKQIDLFSPELKAVREEAYQLRVARNGYEYGQKLLSQKPEAVSMMLEKHKDVPNFMQSIRDGFLVTLKNTDQAAKFRSIADDRTNLQKLILDIFPEDDVDKIISKANIATQSNNAQGYLSGAAGSPTDPLGKAAIDIAQNSAVSGGDISSVVRPLIKIATDARIPEAQAMEIVKLITETNSDLVREALIDANAMNTLQKLMDEFITKMIGERGGQAIAKVKGNDLIQATQPLASTSNWVGGLMDAFVNSGSK